MFENHHAEGRALQCHACDQGPHILIIMKITVSELIVRFLQQLRIRHIFGMPGAHILPVYDCLYHSDIETVLVKHEQGAAFMACGYARVSGEISACITTAGPGATNLVTGIANAYADCQPILVITGETSTHIFGKGGLQESSGEGGSIDQVALFKGITRYNKVVERTDYLGQVLNQAARILLSPNSGPVLLSFPYNVQKEWVDASILDQVKSSPYPTALHRGSQSIEALSELITSALHPVIIAGYGAIRAGAGSLVDEISQRLQIPVATSLKAKGVISEHSPLSLGSLGVTSDGHAYRYIKEHADLIILLGASYNERTSYLWDQELIDGKRLVQIDIDNEQLERVFKADIAIHGDIHDQLTGLLHHLQQRQIERPARHEQLRSSHDSAAGSEHDYSLFQSGFSLIEALFQQLEHRLTEAQLFDDNIIFAQNFFRVSRQQRYYPNSGVSSLGHAIPAAIGARFHTPIPTFAILGDGGFQMCCMEIMTAVNYNIPINIIVFNNATMGLIRKNQHQHYQQRYIDCDFINPDFALLARSFGIRHLQIAHQQQLDQLFSDYDLSHDINLIEIVIDKDSFPNYSSRR